MSDVLASLTGKPSWQVAKAISNLEEMSGQPSEDARLLAEVKQLGRQRLSQLGLDPDDTTAPELYHALLARYSRDAAVIDRALGVTADTDFATRALKASQLVSRSVQLKENWALKKSEARNLIRRNPPKQLMKKLNYRSVDSMLKHVDIFEIFAVAGRLEHDTWHKKIETSLARLSSSSYELRLPLVKIIDNISGRPMNMIAADPVLGVVAVSGQKDKTPTLSIALNILDGLEGMSENRVLHDLHSCHPALNWWLGAEHLLSLHNGEPVSLNFKDVAKNHLSLADFDGRQCAHGHASLWAELMDRYRQYIDELPQDFAAAERGAAKVLMPASELVPELAEI